jgi:hypothetical protein
VGIGVALAQGGEVARADLLAGQASFDRRQHLLDAIVELHVDQQGATRVALKGLSGRAATSSASRSEKSMARIR